MTAMSKFDFERTQQSICPKKGDVMRRGLRTRVKSTLNNAHTFWSSRSREGIEISLASLSPIVHKWVMRVCNEIRISRQTVKRIWSSSSPPRNRHSFIEQKPPLLMRKLPSSRGEQPPTFLNGRVVDVDTIQYALVR